MPEIRRIWGESIWISEEKNPLEVEKENCENGVNIGNGFPVPEGGAGWEIGNPAPKLTRGIVKV